MPTATLSQDTTALFSTLEGIVGRIREAIRGLGPDALSTPEGPGQWSAGQVVRHLADSELVYAVRIRMAIAEDGPALLPLAQEAWMNGLGAVDLDEAVTMLGVLRRATIRLIRECGPRVLDRPGTHPVFGRMTVQDTLSRMAMHDAKHLGQIARIRAAVAPGVSGEGVRLEGAVATRADAVAPRFNGSIAIRDLWRQPNGPAKAIVVEFPPGSAWTGIDHHEPGPEEVFVARGTLVDGDAEYREGSFIHYPAGTAHAPSSPDGCLLHVFYPEG